MDLKETVRLQAKQLTCIRDDRVLFAGLSFELNAGHVLLLEGKNGSGKTSLLRILCGFREPDEGELLWGGDSINDGQYHADMAYVGHLDGVKKELTVFENLKVSLALGVPGRYSILDALTRVNLANYDDVLVQALSAGQKRRLSLARLLITDNKLWILDEPFTSLDKQGIALIETLMIEHCATGGMIVLTSHHDIELHDVVVQRINLS
ncbi:MAG: cytochrome c biogenesis heme-transporting ATPase CcmA [Methylococcales bacterium]|nr:MAG: cytochrome c biogenesis heme-transporting ATPase CcmA [Methylococcales bacterium]